MKLKNMTNEKRLVWDRWGIIHEVSGKRTIEIDKPKYDKRSFKQIHSRKVETGAVKPKRKRNKEVKQ